MSFYFLCYLFGEVFFMLYYGFQGAVKFVMDRNGLEWFLWFGMVWYGVEWFCME